MSETIVQVAVYWYRDVVTNKFVLGTTSVCLPLEDRTEWPELEKEFDKAVDRFIDEGRLVKLFTQTVQVPLPPKEENEISLEIEDDQVIQLLNHLNKLRDRANDSFKERDRQKYYDTLEAYRTLGVPIPSSHEVTNG